MGLFGRGCGAALPRCLGDAGGGGFAEVAGEDFVVGAGGGSLPGEGAAVEDDALVGEGEGAVDELFDDDDGDAGLFEGGEGFEDGVDEFGGEAQAHFVGDHELGGGGQGSGEGEHLLFAAGEHGGFGVAAGGEVGEDGGGGVDGGFALVAG